MATVVSFRRGSALRGWPALVDGAVDGGVVAFALWTLWYEVALAADLDLRPAGWPFAVVTAALVAGGAVLSLRSASSAAPGPSAPRRADRQAGRARAVAVLAGVVLLVVAVLARERLGVLPAALVAIALIVVGCAPGLGRSPAREVSGPDAAPEPDRAPGHLEHLVAALASAGAAVLAILLLKPDADDVFYVNRAAWVAGHGTAMVDDTMFGPGTHPPSFGGGLPTPSVEALQGVVAALLHVEAGTVAYLVYAPVLAAASVWVTWRLVRVWAPRRPLLVLLAALLFLLASGDSIVGSYSIGRMWQGKVTAYAVLLPLVWVHLSHLAVVPARTRQLLLLAAGVAFVGLTTSSALLAPVVAGGALLAALALRSRPLAVGAVAFLAGPLVNGLVQLVGPAVIGTQGSAVTSVDQVFAIAFGPASGMAVLALVGTALAAGIARRPANVVAGAAGIAALATFVPGVIGAADALTGAGPVVWRLAIVAPTWVFVGLLVAAPAPRTVREGSRPAAGAVAAAVGPVVLVVLVVVAVPLSSGHWLWSGAVGARLTASPTWKVDPGPLADLRAARRLDVAPGRWLLPRLQMQDLAISTAGPYAVVPRGFYLQTLDAPAQELADRRTLFALVTRRPVPEPAADNVRDALRRLDVSLACVPGGAPGARRILTAAVGAELRPVGTMWCHVPAP